MTSLVCPECGRVCKNRRSRGIHRSRMHGVTGSQAERMAHWRATNLEKAREHARAWYYRNREAVCAKARKRYRDNPEELRAKGRAWHKKNLAHARAKSREWKLNNRGKVRARKRFDEMNRNARKRAAAGYATREQIAARIAFYGGKCWMCGAPWKHLDHVIPLARGGSNWPANLRPACVTCNVRKWAHKLFKKAA